MNDIKINNFLFGETSYQYDALSLAKIKDHIDKCQKQISNYTKELSKLFEKAGKAEYIEKDLEKKAAIQEKIDEVVSKNETLKSNVLALLIAEKDIKKYLNNRDKEEEKKAAEQKMIVRKTTIKNQLTDKLDDLTEIIFQLQEKDKSNTVAKFIRELKNK